ncbi:MAG: Flp pilus assembly protein CpaB [Vampirovibrio sp.]|nr:Flp pilus assembly protein CpaB [Vampirovibrio sp.]
MNTKTRKPKKALIQLLVAGAVALVFGVIAVVVFVVFLQTQTAMVEDERQKLVEQAEQAEAEAERLKKEKEKLAAKNKKSEFFEVQAVGKINVGTTITQDMITEVKIDSGVRPSMQVFQKASQAIGKVTSKEILPGEVLTKKKIMDASNMIQMEPGLRAMTITLDSVGGLNGALTKGSYVDVLATITKGEETFTKTVIQNAKVIDVGVSKEARTSVVNSVTIAVTPNQAEFLALANAEGKFHLTMRGFSDKDTANVNGADFGSLMSGIDTALLEKSLPKAPTRPDDFSVVNVNYEGAGELPEPSPPKQNEQEFTMQIFKGANAEEKTFTVQH